MFINSCTGLTSEHINKYHQISIINKIIKTIIKYGGDLKGKYNNIKLSAPELMNVEQLKWPILRLKLLINLLSDNKILPQIIKKEFASHSAEEIDDIFKNKICIKVLELISSWGDKKEMSYFINIIKYIHENQEKFEEIKKYIQIFIPYYKFKYSDLDEMSAWLPLILKCIEKKQTFKIIFKNNEEYKFEGIKDKSYFRKLYFYFTSNDLALSQFSKYEIKYKNFKHELEINNDEKKKIFLDFIILSKL